MYRYSYRYNMGPRGRKFGHRGFRPEIFLGILGLMFFGWIILAVIGGLLGAGFMILGSVVSGLARIAPRLFSGILSSRSLVVGLIFGLIWYFRTHKRNGSAAGKEALQESGSTVDGAAVETEIIEEPVYRTFNA